MRYFFHIRDGDRLVRDEEGTDLPNMDAARAEARASARDLMMEDLKSLRKKEKRWLEIANENGRVIETISIRDVLH
jgi:hypothetical protein